MLTLLNVVFLREAAKEILGKMERRKVKGGKTDKIRKTFVFSRFPLVWCNSPTGRRVAFSEPPSRTSKQNLVSKPPYTVETFGVQHRKSCQCVHIRARRRTVLIPKIQCLSVLVFTCFLQPELLLLLLEKLFMAGFSTVELGFKFVFKCSFYLRELIWGWAPPSLVIPSQTCLLYFREHLGRRSSSIWDAAFLAFLFSCLSTSFSISTFSYFHQQIHQFYISICFFFLD